MTIDTAVTQWMLEGKMSNIQRDARSCDVDETPLWAIAQLCLW